MEKLGNEGHDRGEIESAFALLKKSGDYDRVIDDVAKACGVRAPVHVVEEPHVDVRIARVFDKQSHVDTFRKKAAILTEEGTLPLNQQVPLAKELKKRAKECGRELTSAFIREEINAAVMGVKQQERTITREEKQRLEAESFQAKWTQKETNFLQALRMLLSAGLELRELSDKWPKNKAISIDSTKLLDAANRGRKELDKLITKLGG